MKATLKVTFLSAFVRRSYCKTPFTRYNRLSNRLDNWFDNRLNACLHDAAGCSAGCQTGWTTGWMAGCINQTVWIYTTGWTTDWMSVYTIEPVAKPAVKPVRLCRVNGV